ncbi:MAG: hypothetical protein DRP83_03360 [Planctomycetota bacterium]|nr:MAG: hypothetical protein DRP83_03360 [Planctomycetota bacterium]
MPTAKTKTSDKLAKTTDVFLNTFTIPPRKRIHSIAIYRQSRQENISEKLSVIGKSKVHGFHGL